MASTQTSQKPAGSRSLLPLVACSLLWVYLDIPPHPMLRYPLPQREGRVSRLPAVHKQHGKSMRAQMAAGTGQGDAPLPGNRRRIIRVMVGILFRGSLHKSFFSPAKHQRTVSCAFPARDALSFVTILCHLWREQSGTAQAAKGHL
jgi:hypothetical protein